MFEIKKGAKMSLQEKIKELILSEKSVKLLNVIEFKEPHRILETSKDSKNSYGIKYELRIEYFEKQGEL